MASHQEIAHRWAQMNSKLSVRGHHMFADGLDVFSYGRHYVLGSWRPTSPRKADQSDVPAMVAMLNDTPSSVSTAKHRNYVRNAIRGGAWTFTAPSSLWHDPASMLAYFEGEAREAFAKAMRARVYADMHREDAERHLNTAERYARAFGIRYKRPDVAALQAKAEAAARKAQAARAKAEREAKARRAALREEQRADFDAWQRGEGTQYSVPSEWRSDANGAAFIRRAGDNLETSLGASVPWEHAVKAFRFIALCRARGAAWHRNGATVRVGHYQLDAITAEGDMRAGCHTFTWAQMSALAEREGIAATPSSEAVEERH